MRSSLSLLAVALALLLAAPVHAGLPGPQGSVSTSTPTQFPDGTEGAPSVTNLGDTDTGMYWPAANEIAISTGGTKRWHLTSTSLTLTLPLLFPNGTSGAPSITFAGDTDTGFYYAGSHAIGVGMGGGGRYEFNTSRFAPGANNAQESGGAILRWSNTYSVLGNYSGVLTATVGISTDFTDASGTPGNATINKVRGRVAVANGASAVTVTNSTVTATSFIGRNLAQADATCVEFRSVVPGAGTVTFNLNANCTAATNLDFYVVN